MRRDGYGSGFEKIKDPVSRLEVGSGSGQNQTRSEKWACRGVVFGGAIAPNLSASSVALTISAPNLSSTQN